MVNEPVSFVRAVKDFFESQPFGRKVEIAEFRALTDKDRSELHSLLIGEGINVKPFGAEA